MTIACEHEDDACQRISIVARALQISEETWRATLRDYRAGLPPPVDGEDDDGEIRRCLGTLARVYQHRSPHKAPAPEDAPPRVCPACGANATRPFIVRNPGALCYGRCDRCGHGTLLFRPDFSEAQALARYIGRGYYRQRNAEGVGYDAYADEATYRVNKGGRLIEKLISLSGSRIEMLLEVGSGYGFTRVAAERLGVRTAGVDPNPEACGEARERYKLPTFCGTLSEALASADTRVPTGTFDVVLYQFVLEHVVHPARELATARLALRPGGWLLLLVPNMAAAEVDIFQGSYRSFRADHLHLPTRASIDAICARSGFELHTVESTCSIHLFRDILSWKAVSHIYATGRGPDLFALARRTS